MIRKSLYFFTGLIAIVVLLNTNSYSQLKKDYNLFTTNSDNSVLNRPELRNSVDNAVLLNIDKNELANLYENRLQEISLSIPYNNFGNVRINLKRFEVLAPNAKIVERTSKGNEEVKLNDLAVSYKGSIEGVDNTLIVLTFTKNDVKGLMVSGNDNYNLGAINDRNGNQTENYILYKESDLKIKNNFFCGTEDNLSSEYIENMRNIITKGLNDASATDLLTADIAIEIDYATYNVYGQSVTTATNYALTLMANASAIYNKEINVRFLIPYLRVWTSPDPYTGTNSSAVLTQFRSEWSTNQGSVQRTLAHMISRRSGNMGGIAYLNALCSNTYGYGFSNTDGPIQPLPTYSWDVMVVTHEIGHNFGSNHTHNCGWVGGPIDSCYTTEGGCYTGPQIPRIGTIMSYCHLNGSISLTKGFGPQPKTVIRNGAENAGCMTISANELILGYPFGGESFRTGDAREIYWGTSLTGNVNLELSLNNGLSWQTIQNNIPAQSRVYNWTVPYVSSTTQAKIRIINSSNPNSGDTCNSAFKIILNLNAYNLLSPPSFTRVPVAPNNSDLQNFSWSSAGTDPSIRYKMKIRKLATNFDYIYSSNNSGSDTVISLRKSFLDSLASVMGTTGDSVRCTWRAWGYNGIDSSASFNTFIVTLVRTTVGINIISSAVPDKYSLENNYPNPFNPSTNIKFNIPASTLAVLKVYDSKGSEVSTLVNEKLQPGSYEFEFRAENLPSGVYFYRLVTSDFAQTKKMILLK
jgi:hypothetical protein